MMGVPLLRRSDVRAECDECRATFDPARAGGVCDRCHRILCTRHLHGASRLRRLLVELGARSVCERCRST